MNPLFTRLSPLRYKETPIDVDEFFIKCPSCEQYSWADVVILSRYLSYGRIPVFPAGKEANVICKTCGLKRYGMSFNANLVSNFEEVKRKYKHPWFTYIGFIVIVVSVIAIISIIAIK